MICDAPDHNEYKANSGMGMKAKKTKVRSASSKKALRVPKSGRPADSKPVVKFDPLQRYLSEISQYNLSDPGGRGLLGKAGAGRWRPDAAYRW
jgi:hypothetical protein